MGTGSNNFSHMRTRLQRLRDGEVFNGWVMDFNESEAVVRLNAAEDSSEVQDTYLVEIFGKKCDAIFQASVRMGFDNQAYLTVRDGVSYRPASENARLEVDGVSCHLWLNGCEMNGKVIDVSDAGAGVVLNSALAPRAEVVVVFVSESGSLRAEGDVRYCRPDLEGRYRVGLALKPKVRGGKAPWRQWLAGQAA